VTGEGRTPLNRSFEARRARSKEALMTLTRRTPERGVVPLRDIVDWVFQDPWRMLDGDRFMSGGMPIDMRETDDAFIVEAELPGVRPEDTEVTLDGRTLTIRGRYGQSQEQGGGGERYLLRERRSGEMVRSISLPAQIDPERVTSTFDQGELRVTLPKAAETRARKIPIGSGGNGQTSRGTTSSSQSAQSSGSSQPKQVGSS
jgi:HSP20 family protein